MHYSATEVDITNYDDDNDINTVPMERTHSHPPLSNGWNEEYIFDQSDEEGTVDWLNKVQPNIELANAHNARVPCIILVDSHDDDYSGEEDITKETSVNVFSDT